MVCILDRGHCIDIHYVTTLSIPSGRNLHVFTFNVLTSIGSQPCPVCLASAWPTLRPCLFLVNPTFSGFLFFLCFLRRDCGFLLTWFLLLPFPLFFLLLGEAVVVMVVLVFWSQSICIVAAIVLSILLNDSGRYCFNCKIILLSYLVAVKLIFGKV